MFCYVLGKWETCYIVPLIVILSYIGTKIRQRKNKLSFFITTKFLITEQSVLTFICFMLIYKHRNRKIKKWRYRKMIRKTHDNGDKMVIFDSIMEVVQFNRKTERTKDYREYHVSDDKIRTDFAATSSYEEAEDLLLHGWDSMAEKLTNRLGKVTCKNNGYKNKTVYGVQGYQACVPRYLQGMPDSMISNKCVVTKQKVLDIVKDFGYSGVTSTEKIEEESIKVLKLVNSLESKGYRVNLSITFVSGGRKYTGIVMKIKNASQRMNIKQMAFPLVHPSMFRRIVFGLIERLDETKNFGEGYGYCTDYEETKHLFKGQYFIPRIVSEQEITDIEQYKIN